MSLLSVIKRLHKPRPAPLSEAKKRQMAAKKRQMAEDMAKGKRAQLKSNPIKKSKPTSTAREKYIASKAVKPKSKYGRVLARGNNPKSRDRHPPKRRK